MNQRDIDCSSASIQGDGDVLNWHDDRQVVCRLDAGQRRFWFTRDIKFASNGNDFWIAVRYFGFTTKGAAGGPDGRGREKFTKLQQDQIRRKIEEFFSTGNDENIAPFGIKDSEFLGVIFEDGWIMS